MFLRCQCSLSFLTMSNLPWFKDLTFQVPMQYCSLALNFAFTTRHTHNWVMFLLYPSLFILSGAVSLLFSSSILDTWQPEVLIFQCHIFLSFHTVHGVLKARIPKWFAIPFSSGPTFCPTLTKRDEPFSQPLRIAGWRAWQPLSQGWSSLSI